MDKTAFFKTFELWEDHRTAHFGVKRHSWKKITWNVMGVVSSLPSLGVHGTLSLRQELREQFLSCLPELLTAQPL
ncbi:hypothetical protein ACRRTK_017401 [Alexandromys fortis]